MEGVEHEQNGELFEAIQKYRKAVNLVPDIEFKVEQERRRDGDNGRVRDLDRGMKEIFLTAIECKSPRNSFRRRCCFQE